jgi:phenylacetate-CoA ligase
MNKEQIYLHSPVFLQNMMCSLEGWRIQRTRFGPEFQDELRLSEQRMEWGEDRFLAYRDERVSAYVAYCASEVPYYRSLLADSGVDPAGIRSLDDMKQIPILTKDDVKKQYESFLSGAVSPKDRQLAHTSGTTGGGLKFATTLSATQQQWANWWRYRRWHGIDLGTECGYFAGRSIVPIAQLSPPFWRTNRPGRQILFSGYHMNSDNLPHYTAELRRRRPPWLHGYPSLLTLLAGHVIEENDQLDYDVKWITVGAENLMVQQADLIEQAFGVRPIQHYGMAEAVANISECRNGGLHVDEDFSAVEFIPVGEGDTHRVVGTNFTNGALPLLRYDTEDIVTLNEGVCTCGHPGRTVHTIDGRQEDYIILRNGVRLGRLDHIFKDLVHIREAQLYQREPGRITIRIVKGEHFEEYDEAALLRESRQRLGEEMDIDIQYMENLSRTRTGKLRFVVSELKEGQITSQPLDCK